MVSNCLRISCSAHCTTHQLLALEFYLTLDSGLSFRKGLEREGIPIVS